MKRPVIDTPVGWPPLWILASFVGAIFLEGLNLRLWSI